MTIAVRQWAVEWGCRVLVMGARTVVANGALIGWMGDTSSAGVAVYVTAGISDRIRQSWWNPNDERVLTPKVFGVGWAFNLYQVWRHLKLALRD